MSTSAPEFVCPRCGGALSKPGEAYRCKACGEKYPVVAGIPDFRVFPDPWIDIEDDRKKARRVDRLVAGADLEESLRTYWSITPSTPRQEAERFTEHCLRARERSEEWLDLLASRTEEFDAAENDGSPRRPLLDLGCGTADLAAASAARGRAAVGVDIALRWLVVARRRCGIDAERVTLVCACAEALPFPGSSFRDVLSLGLLAHASDAESVASEAHRVLAPDGRLALRTVNRYTLLPEPHVDVWGVGFVPRRWADAYVRWRSDRRYLHHRPLSPAEIRGAMQSAGFDEVTVEAAPTLEAEARRLPPAARRVLPLYEAARTAPGVRTMIRWTAPLLEARGRRP